MKAMNRYHDKIVNLIDDYTYDLSPPVLASLTDIVAPVNDYFFNALFNTYCTVRIEEMKGFKQMILAFFLILTDDEIREIIEDCNKYGAQNEIAS